MSMKIKDPAHAVRVLESLVEQGEKVIHGPFPHAPFVPSRQPVSSYGDDNLERFNKLALSLIPALVEGAKAVLAIYKNPLLIPEKDFFRGIQSARDEMIYALAQAYVLRMAEAGMEVPE